MERNVWKPKKQKSEAMNHYSWHILVASYLFEVTNTQFKEVLWGVIYIDDGLLVFKGKRSMSDIRIWRNKFHEKFDEIARNEYLQFTCDRVVLSLRPGKDDMNQTQPLSVEITF